MEGQWEPGLHLFISNTEEVSLYDEMSNMEVGDLIDISPKSYSAAVSYVKKIESRYGVKLTIWEGDNDLFCKRLW
jgi:hypothetical protein